MSTNKFHTYEDEEVLTEWSKFKSSLFPKEWIKAIKLMNIENNNINEIEKYYLCKNEEKITKKVHKKVKTLHNRGKFAMVAGFLRLYVEIIGEKPEILIEIGKLAILGLVREINISGLEWIDIRVRKLALKDEYNYWIDNVLLL